LGNTSIRPQQRRYHRDITDRVDEKTNAFAELGDHDAGQGGANDARGVDHRRVQRHGVGEIIGFDELMNQRLACRHVESVDQSKGDAKHNDVRGLNPTRQSEQRQQQRLGQSSALTPHGNPVARVAVADHATDRSQEKYRNLRGETYDAEQGR